MRKKNVKTQSGKKHCTIKTCALVLKCIDFTISLIPKTHYVAGRPTTRIIYCSMSVAVI